MRVLRERQPNLARDPQNMPWPNMGCATQRSLAAVVADPQGLLGPRGGMPRAKRAARRGVGQIHQG
ncbi:MAG: CpaD family pilus assembly lipoprotein [Methyloceanibacter sp.]